MSTNLGECSDPENIVSDHVEEIEYDFDTFDNFAKKIKKSEQELQIFEQDSKDSFYLAIIYATFYALLEKIEDLEFCQGEGKLTRVLEQSFFEELTGKRENFQLDLSLSNFQAPCHVVNDLLKTKRLLLRVYELRKKFCQEGSSGLVEKRFNGFEIVRKVTEDQRKENFQPIEIVYKPVSKISQTINCYFSKSMRNAYHVVGDLKKGKDVSSVDQCFACNKFFTQKKFLQRRLQVCSSMPRIICKFENQNIQTFFDIMNLWVIFLSRLISTLRRPLERKSITLAKTVALTLSLIPLW